MSADELVDCLKNLSLSPSTGSSDSTSHLSAEVLDLNKLVDFLCENAQTKEEKSTFSLTKNINERSSTNLIHLQTDLTVFTNVNTFKPEYLNCVLLMAKP